MCTYARSVSQHTHLFLPHSLTVPLQRLGKGLQGLPRDQVVLATKFGRYGPNLFDFSAERVRGMHQFSGAAQLRIESWNMHAAHFESLAAW